MSPAPKRGHDFSDEAVHLRPTYASLEDIRISLQRRTALEAARDVLDLQFGHALSAERRAAVAQRLYSPQSGTPLDNYMTVVSIALGVFLLAISLLEWGAAYGAEADALHRNAEDLTAYELKLAQVLAKMDAGMGVENPEVDALRLEYETIKDRCPYNHAPSDHELFRVQQRMAPELGAVNGKPAITDWDALVIKARWQWSTIWLFLLIWIIVTVAGAYAFWIPKT